MNDISSFAWSTLHNIYTNGARFAHNAVQSNPNAFYWFRWENNHNNSNNHLTQPPSLLPSNISVKIIDGIDAVRSIHPNYWAVACITALSCLIVYIKLRYPFWNQVAALHTFDWHRRYLYRDRPYTIRLLPHKTRYYDTDHIQTGFFRQLTNEKIKESVELLQNHYIPTDRMFCALQEASWAAYFAEGHAHPAIVSLYNEVVHEVDGEPTEIGDAEDVHRIVKEHTKTNIVGLVTSRSVNFTIKGFGKDNGVVSFPVYFMDYFCFHREAVTPLKLRQLFSTHEFNQRVFHAAINVTLFKKEVTLCEGLVPLIQYKTYTYYLPAEVRLRAVPQNFQLVRIQREYLHHLYDFVGQLPQLNDFVLTVVADVGALVALLRANQLFAYVLRGPEEGVVQVESVEVGGKNTNVRRLNKVKLDTMYGLYFFRNAQVKNDDLEGSDTLQLAAAFCNTNNEELFFTGFVWALKECLKDMGGNTRMMMVDDIGHAQRLRKRWSMKNSTVFECECAYYVCNYVVPRSPLNTSTSFLLL